MRGKALWVRPVGLARSNPSAFADRYARAGFRWAAPLVLWGGQGLIDADDLCAQLADAGVQLWPTWGLPTPATWRDRIDPFLDYAVQLGAAGVIVDPEAEWKGQQAEAEAFAAALRDGCDRRGLRLAITSYSLPSAHRSFPWAAFAAVADVGIAQTYDRDLAFDPRYPVRAQREWERAGFDVVVLAGGLWNHRDRRDKSAAETARHLALLPRQEAAILWSDGSIADDVWNVLVRWNPNAARGGGGLLGLAGVAAFVAGVVAIARRRR